MTTDKSLVERLRDDADAIGHIYPEQAYRMLVAADRLEALTAQLAAEKARADAAEGREIGLNTVIDEIAAGKIKPIPLLEAEAAREKAEAALKEIADSDAAFNEPVAASIALAALGGTL